MALFSWLLARLGSANAWGDLGREAIRRFENTGDMAALDEAVDCLTSAVQAADPMHRSRPAYFTNLATAYSLRYENGGADADLDAAISCDSQAVATAQADDPEMDRLLANLGSDLLLRYKKTGEFADLQEAVRIGTRALRITANDTAARPVIVLNLALCHHELFIRTGDQAHLDEAIRVGRDAIRATPGGHPDRARSLSTLAPLYRSRFERRGVTSDIELAIRYEMEAVHLAPPGHPDRSLYMTNLGNSLLSRYENTGALQDLESAIGWARAAVDATPRGHPRYVTCLQNLGLKYRARFERLGALEDLDAALFYGRSALLSTAVGHPDRAMRLLNMGVAHWARFERVGTPEDVEAAISYGLEAFNAFPAGHSLRVSCMTNLGVAYAARHGHTGSLADLDASVHWSLETVRACPKDHPDYARYLSNLGVDYLRRSARLRDRADMNEAIRCLSKAVAATPAKHPLRAMRDANLGLAYRIQYEQTDDASNLEAAIQCSRHAVATTPEGHPDQARYLSGLGDDYEIRFELFGNKGDLEEAISLFALALDLTSRDHPRLAETMSHLGALYRMRFEVEGDSANLREALRLTSLAVNAAPNDSPGQARVLYRLAMVHEASFKHSKNEDDLEAAVRCWSMVAAMRTADPFTRIRAAQAWGDACAAAADVRGAFEGYATAVELLPVVVWRGLGRQLREAHLKDLAGLASRAAAWAIEANMLERAVELLEQGRSVLWSQVLQTRTDLTELRGRQPHLAARLEQVGLALGLGDTEPQVLVEPHGASTGSVDHDSERMAARYRRLAEEWEQLIEHIRSLDGFAAFLGPTPFEELRECAGKGPVVIVNISARRCDALVLTPTGVKLCPLPDVTEQDCAERVKTLLRALSSRGQSHEEAWALQANRTQVLFGTLTWLWDRICEPTLRDIESSMGGHSRTRMWWCPTGPLALLPLHAAGRHQDSGGRYLAEIAVPSYTPTLGALIRARRSSVSPRTPLKVLAVGMPTTPGPTGVSLGDLAAVPEELDRLRMLLPLDELRSPTRQELNNGVRIPEKNLPTCDRVLAAMNDHRWVHFACHGSQDPTDPSRGALHLIDGPLTVIRVAAQALPAAELAFLSACQTAVGGSELPDEAVHLAAAMQFTGFCHVIATAWSISDAHAPDIADRTYAHLTAGGMPEADRAAMAIQRAADALRREEPFRPDLWAAYLHIGP